VLNESLFRGDVHPIFFASKIISTRARGPRGCGVYPYAVLVPFYGRQMVHVAFRASRACILFATFKILRSDRSSRWTGYGLLWGFELMTNAAFASIATFLLLWLALRLRAARRAWMPLAGARGSGARSGLRGPGRFGTTRVSHLGSAAPEFRLRALAL